MKFGRAWRERVQRLPPDLAAACVHYKRWKKSLRCSGGERARSAEDAWRDLQDELRGAETAFAEAVAARRRMVCALLSPCFGSCPGGGRRRGGMRADQLLEYAALNRTAAYKVCKRIDKTLGGGGFDCRARLAALVGTHSLEVLGGSEVRALELECGAAAECPVCLEVWGPGRQGRGRVVLLRCGHTLCLPCALAILGVPGGSRGTPHNLLGYGCATGGELRCPSCRCGTLAPRLV